MRRLLAIAEPQVGGEERRRPMTESLSAAISWIGRALGGGRRSVLETLILGQDLITVLGVAKTEEEEKDGRGRLGRTMVGVNSAIEERERERRTTTTRRKKKRSAKESLPPLSPIDFFKR